MSGEMATGALEWTAHWVLQSGRRQQQDEERWVEFPEQGIESIFLEIPPASFTQYVPCQK